MKKSLSSIVGFAIIIALLLSGCMPQTYVRHAKDEDGNIVVEDVGGQSSAMGNFQIMDRQEKSKTLVVVEKETRKFLTFKNKEDMKTFEVWARKRQAATTAEEAQKWQDLINQLEFSSVVVSNGQSSGTSYGTTANTIKVTLVNSSGSDIILREVKQSRKNFLNAPITLRAGETKYFSIQEGVYNLRWETSGGRSSNSRSWKNVILDRKDPKINFTSN